MSPPTTEPPAAEAKRARFAPRQFDADDLSVVEPQLGGEEAFPREVVLLNASEQDIAALLARGFTVLDRSEGVVLGGNLLRLQVPDDLSTSAGLVVARQIAQSAIADFNHVYRPGQGGAQAALRQRALIVWPQPPQVCNVDAVVGLIDTRVDLETPALKGQAVETIDGVSSGRKPSGPAHGTAIAALLAGRSDAPVAGLLPSARLIAIEAFHLNQSGEDIADTFDIVRAIDVMLGREVPVVNLSFTGPANELLAQAVRIAAARNVALVASAGNQGPRSGPLYPAAYDGAVAVTAVSVSLRVYRKANRGRFIDLAGPGVGIEVIAAAPTSLTRIESGTSFATPFVTAAIAAALARRGGPVGETIEMLKARAMDLGRQGPDATFGWGLIQAEGICQ